VQGYLSATSSSSVRVRIEDGQRAWLTIKSAVAGTTRQEFEYEIPAEDAKSLLQLGVGSPIAKTRYRVPVDRHVWEVDVFEGANTGLVVAEIELESESEEFSLPDWIGKEISADKRYYNAALTHAPYSTWTKK
jgi:adenylate cyclase